MTHQYPLIDVNDVASETPVQTEGGTSPDIRFPIGGNIGSSTTAVHVLYGPGSALGKHVHNDCDEISILLRGRGIAGQDGERAKIRAGHCRLIPKGAERFFANASKSEDALVVGFLIGAPDPAASGLEYRGPVSQTDMGQADLGDAGAGFTDGIMVHLDDVRPENMAQGDGWLISDFRLPIGGHNGSTTTLFRARFSPGAVHKKHRHENCDEIYYIIGGHGLAGAGPDRVEVRGGHFHYIPRGVEHWLHNLSETDPIEVVGIYVRAGSVAETGYVYMGNVSAADLEQRTG